MKKWLFPLLVIALLSVAGCHAQLSTAQPTSDKVLNQSENIWHDTGSWLAGKYSPQAKNVAPTIVVTRHGSAVGTTKITYTEAKTAILQNESQAHRQWFSVKQLNASLAKANAGIRLKAFSDLALFRSTITPAPTVGYVAHGHRLYAISICTQAEDKTKLAAITVYANTGKTPTRVATTALAGRWVGADGTQLRVIGNKLYHNDTLGAARYLLQPLRQISADTLYTATYRQHLALAAQHGYRLAKATTTMATDGSALYVFISKTRMVAITATGQVTYTKTDRGKDTSQVKADIMQVFQAADASKDRLPAISVANIGSANYEVACHAFSMLTDPYTSKDIDWQKATVVNGHVTLADMYPELP
ncbi:hypothetical protein ACFQ5J_07905 [Lacticaseibacillus baoqingensis]|uniref:Lipoprotein n=1 Tax=Lacticaseibacillus baoqingensis TaxID=2486013 RepID=A0ABW4E9P6_9LACO|nr:hypothetical protein [Lacticaseibacillus baoqingensis]